MLDNFLRNLIYKEWCPGKFRVRFLDVLFLVCTVLFGFLIRIVLKEEPFLMPGDFLCALAAGYIVLRENNKPERGFVAFTVTMFLPVILLNSAMAAGWDSYFSAVLLLSLFCLGKGKTGIGFFLYGLACVFYFPSIFLLPVYILSCQQKKNGYMCAGWLLMPVAYSVWQCVHGSTMQDVLCKYVLRSEGAGFGQIVYGCPNIWQIIGSNVLPGEYALACMAFTVFLFTAVLYYLCRKQVELNVQRVLGFALFFMMTAVFFMPYMYAGYGVLLSVLGVVLTFYNIKKIYIPLLTMACYFGSQTCWLAGTTMVPLYIYAFVMLALLVLVGLDMYRDIRDVVCVEKNQRVYDTVFLLLVTLLGLCIRWAFRDVQSMDYQICLKPWVDTFKEEGSFRAIAGDFYNYTPPYMYILYVISRFKTEPLYLIKLVSVFFDFLLSAFGAGIVMELTKSRRRSVLAYGILFTLPTVAVNSGLWGQCDVMYVTCIIISLYYIIKDRANISMLWFGMAFALKLQSLFVFPFYLYLWVKKKYKISQFLYIPLVYMTMCIPSALAGKSIRDLLMVYVDQGNTEPWMLSWNWPNIYLLFGPTNFYELYRTAGVIGTLIVLMLILYYMVKKNTSLGGSRILYVMLMFAVVVPYFLPYMHERYGYLADILAVVLFLVKPSVFYIAILQVLLSYTAYTGYLHGGSAVPQTVYCFAMIVLVFIVVKQTLCNPKKVTGKE